MIKRYNHAFTMAFSVSGSETKDGSDITKEQYIEALQQRIKDLSDEDQIQEAIGAPFDTYEEFPEFHEEEESQAELESPLFEYKDTLKMVKAVLRSSMGEDILVVFPDKNHAVFGANFMSQMASYLNMKNCVVHVAISYMIHEDFLKGRRFRGIYGISCEKDDIKLFKARLLDRTIH